MSFLHKVVVLGPPLLLVLLTAMAGAVYSRIENLSLPISQILTLFTVALPLVTGLSTHGATVLTRRGRKKQTQRLSLPLLSIYGALLIYETIIATLAANHIVPPSSLLCGLEERWTQLFRNKDANAIRAIQDTLSCCGFRTTSDRAWPFGYNRPSTCRETFNRLSSCVGAWRQAEQLYAGLLLMVALVAFVLTVFSLLSCFSNTFSNRPQWAIEDVSDDPREDGERAEVRRLIEEGDSSARFRDEPEEETPQLVGGADGERPRIEPSQLQDVRNEWQD